MILNIFKTISVVWSALRSFVITALIFSALNVHVMDDVHLIVFALVFILVWVVDLGLSMVLSS